GGVGVAGDAYEQHADAVADAVVAGQSAAPLLDRVTGRGQGAAHAIQRKEGKADAKILENQASLKGPDVEIPALEGALLATRMEAVKQGLLSQASFDAGLKLSQAMTRLQPAVAANGPIDVLLQQTAVVAAHQLFAALRTETADEKNFQTQTPGSGRGGGITSVNPYTEEVRLSHYGMVQHTSSLLEQLPELILERKWTDAFANYRRLLDGLDLWVADQLRKKGKGTPEEARGNQHQHNSQLRTGLEPIAGKDAKRIPALFHPDADTLAKEKAAGRPIRDAIPMNVYFWKDNDGKHHLYDLTTPGRPREQTLAGAPTMAMMNTFFEEVARYPEGDVRYTLPDGVTGLAPTSGKTKWYEWVGYAGLAAAAVGLAFVTGGASVPATVCFAAGALATGVSAAGHLVDTAQLGTATTATVVLDVAQIAGSFASFGALSITLKAGGAAAALAGSRWFVPVVSVAGVADGVQLVALTDITYVELTKIQQGAGSPEDKQRATAVLLTQLAVMGGLTALSVQGVRDAHVLPGKQLEVVEQNRSNVLRVVGETTPEPVPRSETKAPPPVHPTTPEPAPHPETKASISAHETPSAEPSKAPHDVAARTSKQASDDAAEPFGPAELTEPSGKPDPRAAPSGRRTTPPAGDKDPVNIRSLAQENESADILSKQGYRVEQNPNVPGRKNPDFRIEGDIFDNYAPTTSNHRSIWTTIQGKVREEQAHRIILNLSSSGVDLVKLKAQFTKWPVDGLDQVIVIRGTSVIAFWP
ncbi:MAG: hypothetical protein H7138_13680, partial [Myxococcales bacterium]|nr:hypothetical protein [Myxococcales bacterium]